MSSLIHIYILKHVITENSVLRLLVIICKMLFIKMAQNTKKFPIRMNGKSWKNFAKNDQTHPSLNLYCFHIVSATDFIQTLNKTEDFELLILYSCFCYLLPFFRYYSYSFMPFLFLFRSYNGCIVRKPQQARVSHMTVRDVN